MTDDAKEQHPIVTEMLAELDESLREFYEERAGIFQFEAGFDRDLAEALALLEVIRLQGWPMQRK